MDLTIARRFAFWKPKCWRTGQHLTCLYRPPHWSSGWTMRCVYCHRYIRVKYDGASMWESVPEV